MRYANGHKTGKGDRIMEEIIAELTADALEITVEAELSTVQPAPAQVAPFGILTPILTGINGTVGIMQITETEKI